MVKVPFSPVPTAQIDTGSLAKQNIQATPQSFGSGIGEGLQTVGQEFDKAGDQLAQHAIYFQQLDNKAESDNLNTEYLNKSNTLLFGDGQSPGYFDLKGKSAVDAFGDARTQLLSLRDEVAGKASNPIVQTEFDANSRRQSAYSLSDMSRHAAQERNVYLNNTSAGAIASYQNDMALYPNDPARFSDNLAKIGEEVQHNSAREGDAPDEMAKKQARAQSVGIMSAVKSLSSDDPFKAQDLFYNSMDKLDAQAVLEGKQFFKNVIPPTEAYGAVQLIASGQLAIPKQTDLAAVIEQTGEHGKTGQVSPKGATGVMQLMPATAQAQATKLGIPFDPDKLANDDEYNRTLGRGEISDLMRRYSMNTAVATAAYNAGRGNVNKWIAQNGDPSKGEISVQDWINKIPFKETRDYVIRVIGALNISHGVQPTSEDPRDHLDQYLSQSANAATYSDNPIFAKTLDSQTRAEVGHLASAVTASRTAASNTLLTATMGGQDLKGPKPQNVQQLLQSYPGAQDDWARLNPTQQEHMLKTLEGNAKGETIQWNPDRLKLNAQLEGMYNNDPDSFKTQDFSSVDLPYSARRALMDKQVKLNSAPPQNEGILHAVSVAKLSGFDIQTRSDNPEAYDQFTGAMSQRIDHFVDVHNRKPNDNDISKMTSELMLSQSKGFLSGNKYAYQNPYGSLVQGVPDADAKAIVSAHKQKFGSDPDSGAIKYWYDRLHHGR